jgi:hypothetical protein
VIRQAISCDICGREMQNPNHWFVVYDRGPEFRMTRWNTRTRLRPEARHLCGQTCLHKLVDDFMARTISERTSTATADKADQPQPEKAQPEKEKQTQQSGIKPADASLAAAPPQTTPTHLSRHLHRRLRIIRASHHAHRARAQAQRRPPHIPQLQLAFLASRRMEARA